MNRVLTDEEIMEVRARYQGDRSLSAARLADEYGVSKSVMLRAIRGVQRSPGGKPRVDVDTDSLRRMYYDEGMTLAQIGRQKGLSESGVWRRIHREREAV